MGFKVYFGLASLAILVLCVLNYWIELTPTWGRYQREYYDLLATKVEDPAEAAQIAATPARFAQIYNQPLGVADRCVICHLGMENQLMDGVKNPYKVHPGKLLATHPVQSVGCTICHQGQGLATTVADAHGNVPHWDKTLLAGHFVQASCTKCHHEEEIPDAPVLTRGKHLLHDLGCVGCHRTGEGSDDEKVGPRLAVVGSKVSRKWLDQWLINPKNYLPKGQMPQFHLRPKAADALAAYLVTFKDDKTIDRAPEPKGDHDAGAVIFRRLQCITCHVTREDTRGNPVGGTIGPDLRKVGSKVNKRWLAAFLRDPHAFYPHTKMPRFYLSEKEVTDLTQYAVEEWVDYEQDAEKKQPATSPDEPALVEQGKNLYAELACSGCHDLTEQKSQPTGPDLTYEGSKAVHDLDFGAAEVRRTVPDFLYAKLKTPQVLNQAGALNPLKMPDFQLNDPDAEALTIALMSQSAERVSLATYEVPAKRKPIFDPQDDFGGLAQRYRCLSCHSIRGSGDPQACDITWEGSKVTREWLYGFLKNPYSMRRTITIAMPLFNFPDEQARFMSEYMSAAFADRQIGAGWKQGQGAADAARGKALFDAKGCIACHQVHGKGGDVGPSFTTQVPEFPQGTWVGDKLRPEWVFQWLKNPRALVPDTLEPNLGLSDQEALDLTKYVISLKNPDFHGDLGKKQAEKSANNPD
ncbi:MAG: c-type cytochrome [Thermoguttaceae bacterium]